MNQRSITVVLAAGGTGGHIFPAQALAAELQGRDHRAILLTDKRYRNYASDFRYDDVHIIASSSISGNVFKKIVGTIKLIFGLLQALRLLVKLKPAVVIGFGGYPSLPTLVAASKLGIPIILHEQNSVMGKVNKLFVPSAKCVASSFADLEGIEEQDKAKIQLTGNPVRPEIKAVRDKPYPEIAENDEIAILVTGGSQGANIFAEVVPHAIGLIPIEQRQNLFVQQQCRPEDMDKVTAYYDSIGVRADLAPFFTDMPERLSAAHIVIARSGASTVAEITVTGRPAILVPYPHALGDHQMANALSIGECGGGWVIAQEGFTVDALAEKLKLFLNEPVRLSDAAAKSRDIGVPDADKQLAELVENLA